MARAGELADALPDGVSVVEHEPLSGQATLTVTIDEGTELTGNVKLRLWVSTSEGTVMDLFVGVHELDADVNEVHSYTKTGLRKGPVAMGRLRVSVRALDEDRSTPWQPVLSYDNPQPLTAKARSSPWTSRSCRAAPSSARRSPSTRHRPR